MTGCPRGELWIVWVSVCAVEEGRAELSLDLGSMGRPIGPGRDRGRDARGSSGPVRSTQTDCRHCSRLQLKPPGINLSLELRKRPSPDNPSQMGRIGPSSAAGF